MQVLERILAVDYHFPSSIPVSEHCKDLLRHILVADPAKRFSIADIQKHPWCVSCLQCSGVLKALPARSNHDAYLCMLQVYEALADSCCCLHAAGTQRICPWG